MCPVSRVASFSVDLHYLSGPSQRHVTVIFAVGE